MKKLGIVLIGILAVVLILSFTKDMIIKASVEKGTEIVTGLRLSMQGFRVGIINTLVGIRGLRLFNPKGFKDRLMLDMPEIYVDYDLGAIMKGTVHLEEMRINMKEFTVVKNEKGELNLNSLKVVQARKDRKKPGEKEKGKIPEIQIDSLELKIGKVVYKDYSRGGQPSVKEFAVDLNEKYENITNPYSLVSLIVVKALMGTNIANLTNFDLADLKGTVSDTLKTAQKVAEQTIAEAEKVIGETAKETRRAVEEATQTTQAAMTEATQSTQGAVKETTEAIKKTTESLKDVFKSPFGSEK